MDTAAIHQAHHWSQVSSPKHNIPPLFSCFLLCSQFSSQLASSPWIPCDLTCQSSLSWGSLPNALLKSILTMSTALASSSVVLVTSNQICKTSPPTYKTMLPMPNQPLSLQLYICLIPQSSLQ